MPRRHYHKYLTRSVQEKNLPKYYTILLWMNGRHRLASSVQYDGFSPFVACEFTCEFLECEHIRVGQVISVILHVLTAITEDDNVSHCLSASTSHEQGDEFVTARPFIFIEAGDTIFVCSATFNVTISCLNT
jgi:hypothetical protein